jgi:hypothetical protein
MLTRLVIFLALVVTAIALAPGLAHLFSMNTKMRAGQNDYFVMQQAYNGWALLGVALFAAVFVNALAAWLIRTDPASAALFAFAAALMIVNLAVFFGWTFPANQATRNWTVAPENWRALRRNWELSHAVNALITLGAFMCAAWGAVRR